MQAALIILDGWALGDHDHLDAVKAAETPTFDRLCDRGAFGTLVTHGRRVGLPSGQMGNSEVGHLNIGAGRVVVQESARITDAIRAGRLGETEVIDEAFTHAEEGGRRVHFLGLVSDGGVHSHQQHLHGLIESAAERDVEAVTHVFTDGRDTPPQSAPSFLTDLDEVVRACGTGEVASVTGRYYAMDRDEHWDRTKRAYDAIVRREAPHEAPSAIAAVEQAYTRGDRPDSDGPPGDGAFASDEFIEPTLVQGGPALSDGDAAVFFNYRADRARQLTRMLIDGGPASPVAPPEMHLATMTEYDRSFLLPVAFPPPSPEPTLGEMLADMGLTQLRIAESEKYAHVTYFLNGGREIEFSGERRRIVQSPDVSTYDQQPEMSAPAVTTTALDEFETADPDVCILNYANPDMVGHTGDYAAAIAAVEAVDEQLGRLLDGLRSEAHVIVTADHGNADDMGTPTEPHTAHTRNPVPFVYLAPDGTDGGYTVASDGTLEDVTPTLLALLGIEKPPPMTGASLLA